MSRARPQRYDPVVRLPETLHLLAFIADETSRRRMLTQRNRGERRHSLARAIFHGQQGERRQRYREGQEDQLGALGLAVNALVLWTTRSTDLALAQVRREGVAVRDESRATLAPGPRVQQRAWALHLRPGRTAGAGCPPPGARSRAGRHAGGIASAYSGFPFHCYSSPGW